MSLIRKFLDKLRPKPPVIETPWGAVTESARAQAATNLRLDPAKRAMVLGIIVKECGGDAAKGLAEARRRYPEVNWP
jgi:hypothetical protein